MKKEIVGISYLISEKGTVTHETITPPKLRARSRMIRCPEGFGETEIKWESYNNTSIIEMCTHSGTHIDAPFHCNPRGLTVDSFDFSDFVFNSPALIELSKGDLEKITKDDMLMYKNELEESDLLLVYTGFSRYRESDPRRYLKNQPGFSAEAAKYLIDNYPLKAVGIDLTGIENVYEAKPEFPAHNAFFKNERFLLVEDMDLTPVIGKKLIKVYIVPLRVKGAEAMPVTAFAEVEGN
jgi:arylformamidase